MLVSGKKEDTVVGVKDVLCSVPVMNIPIDDRNSLKAVFFLGVSGGDGGIVENAEAHTPIGRCVVSGRANRAKRVLKISLHDSVDCIEESSTCLACLVGRCISSFGRASANVA